MYQYDKHPRLTLYRATTFYSIMKHQRLDCPEIRLGVNSAFRYQLSSIETCEAVTS